MSSSSSQALSSYRLLIFGMHYPPEATGNAPYTGALAAGLVSRGREVHVLTAHPHYPQWRIHAGYGQWTRAEVMRGVIIRRLRHFVPRRPTPAARVLSEVTFGFRQMLAHWRRPSAIIAVSPAMFSSALVCLRWKLLGSRAPFVVWVQDLYGAGMAETAQASGVTAKLVAGVEAWLLRSASLVVVIHERFAARVSADIGVPAERIKIVRNWTHLPRVAPADVGKVRSEYGWEADDTIVVHSGNMGVKQGLHHVVDAARLAGVRGEKIRFVLVGDGSQREQIQAAAIDIPYSIQFIPPLEQQAFMNILQAADILLVSELPGVSEMAVPSKLTSYFSVGRPVLAATDTAGITAGEIRAAQAGIVVPSGDPEALLNAVSVLAGDRESAAVLGANGKRYRDSVLDESVAIEQFDLLLADITRDC